jgi:hypothetical protein
MTPGGHASKIDGIDGKGMETATMRHPRLQFRIGHLMIAVAAVAVVMVLPPFPRPLVILIVCLSIPCLAAIAARWLLTRGRRRLAARSFWAVATAVNLVVAALCIAPDINSIAFALLGPVLWGVALPSMIAIGVAWVLLLSRDPAVPERSREVANYLIFVAAALPFLTLWTLWPLRLAFLVVRPSLDRLANQVAVGSPLGYPTRVGPFRIVAPAVSPVRGYIGLKVDEKGIHTGFVRIHRGSTPTTHGPFVGVNFDVHLGGGWWYRG